MASLRYLRIILRHKYWVARAGRIVGVSWWQLFIHDLSKFGPSEFGPYKRRFVSGRAGKSDKEADPSEFHRAWNHHWRVNPHHWEYWTRWKDSAMVPMAMPEKYVREMVADWCGASKAYSGDWTFANWYREHRDKILLHSDTRTLVELHLSVADLKLHGQKSDRLDV